MSTKGKPCVTDWRLLLLADSKEVKMGVTDESVGEVVGDQGRSVELSL